MQTNEQIQSSLDGLSVFVSDPRSVWSSLQIAPSVPLGHIEWPSKLKGNTIQEVSTTARINFQLAQDDATTRPERIHTPFEWHRNPYVYIMLVTIVDIDPLKDAAAWGCVNRFVDSCREHFYEFLVVLVASDAEFQSNKRIVDKLKLEVNLIARGKERVVILPPASSVEEQRPITNLHNSPIHHTFHAMLKGCVRDGAVDRIKHFEEEITRYFLCKGSASWSFANFFLLKESMAFLYVQLGRRDISVRKYDELHTLIVERNEKGNGHFCDHQAAEVALGVINPYFRNYRKLITENTISELDLYTYVFSRQASLLLADRKFSEVAERGLKFITSQAKRCAEEAMQNNQLVTAVFRDIWVFITARAIAASLAPAIPSPSEAVKSLSAQLSTQRERHIARLTAGFHVHASKAFLGLAHIVLPGCLAPEDPSPVPNRDQLAEEAKKTANEKLNNALSSQKKAELLYSEIANAAASLYEMGGRARGAAALDGDAGIVRLRNESYEEAETLLGAQCSRYSNDNGWDILHMRRRIELAKVEKQLDRIQEYLVSCLTIVCMHRTSRRLYINLAPTDESEDELQNLDFWINEVTSTAFRLPRVMRYKADKLFDVSVIHHDSEWLEGDPGKAVVHVVSDIPGSFIIDSLAVEYRCLNTPVGVKPAMHVRENGSSPVGHEHDPLPSSTGLSPISSASLSPIGVDKLDTLILRTKDKIECKEGKNEFEVYTEEIPQWGRYKVVQVALYIGKLKMTQAANKTLGGLIVTTKGQGGHRNNAGTNNLSLLADLNGTHIRFPPAYAKKRNPVAYLDIPPEQPLYLAPDLEQYVHVKIRAGEHGVASGGRLKCLIIPDASSDSIKVNFVDIGIDKNFSEDENVAASDASVFDIQKAESIPREMDDIGSAIFPCSLEKGQTLETKIRLKMLPDMSQYRIGSEYDGLARKSYSLRLEFSCCENRQDSKRIFTCDTESTIVFESPIELKARLEITSDWWDKKVAPLSARDGTPLRGGGTLICYTENKLKERKNINLSSLSLECPSWLELRADETPVHDELLPCKLGPKTVFAGVFDLLVRDELCPQVEQIDQQGAQLVFSNRSLPRAHSRTLEAFADENESQEDLMNWKPDLRQAVLSERQERQSPSLSETSGEIVDSRGDSNRERNQSKTFTENSGVESLIIEGSSFEEATSNDDILNVREEGDVVDLSTPSGENHQLSSLMSPPATPSQNSHSIVTVRLCLSIDGVHGETTIERKIAVGSLRTSKKRFLVQRTISETAETGRPMALTFSVQCSNIRLSTYSDVDEPVELQYELEADPSVWQLVGRRRGQLKLGQTGIANGTASIIPLICGRHRAPRIRLYTSDGRGLPLSRYENANEYMQVMVMPCRTIVSACKLNTGDEGHENDGNIDGVEGSLPVVIAPDSFFN